MPVARGLGMVNLTVLLTSCVLASCVGIAGIVALLRKRVTLAKVLLAAALLGGAAIGGLELRAASVRGECRVVHETLGAPYLAGPGDSLGSIAELRALAAKLRADVAAWRTKGAERSSAVAKDASRFADALEQRAALLERAGTPDEESLVHAERRRAEAASAPRTERERVVREAVNDAVSDLLPENHLSSVADDELRRNAEAVNEARDPILTRCYEARFDWH